MSLTGSVDHHEFPQPSGGMRVEFSWKLFLNGKCVARSEDYFLTYQAAEVALGEFLAVAPEAGVIGPCKTCAAWKPSPANAPTLTCRDCGRVV